MPPTKVEFAEGELILYLLLSIPACGVAAVMVSMMINTIAYWCVYVRAWYKGLPTPGSLMVKRLGDLDSKYGIYTGDRTPWERVKMLSNAMYNCAEDDLAYEDES